MSENSRHHELHDSRQHIEDEKVRAHFVTLIAFVAAAKGHTFETKAKALKAIENLQARLLP